MADRQYGAYSLPQTGEGGGRRPPPMQSPGAAADPPASQDSTIPIKCKVACLRAQQPAQPASAPLCPVAWPKDRPLTVPWSVYSAPSAFPAVSCQGLVLFWEDTDEILQVQCGPFPKGTVVRIQSLQNDPMQLSGKVGTIAWLVPGGAAVTIDGIQDAVKVQDAAMTKELGVHCELVGEKVGVHMSSPPSAALSVRNMLSTVQPRRLGMLKHGQALCVMRVGGWVMLCACAALLDASGETLQIQATDPQMIFRYWLNPAA